MLVEKEDTIMLLEMNIAMKDGAMVAMISLIDVNAEG
jgi:hypothetical protein